MRLAVHGRRAAGGAELWWSVPRCFGACGRAGAPLRVVASAPGLPAGALAGLVGGVPPHDYALRLCVAPGEGEEGEEGEEGRVHVCGSGGGLASRAGRWIA